MNNESEFRETYISRFRELGEKERVCVRARSRYVTIYATITLHDVTRLE